MHEGMMPKREFYVVIGKGEDGHFIGEAPQLRECFSRGRTLDELIENMRKSIQARLVDDDLDNHAEFVGVYRTEAPVEGKNRDFFVVVEKDEDQFFVGEVTQLRSCFSQGRSLEELMENMREAICLCLDDEEFGGSSFPEFLGVQRVLA